MKLDPQKDFYYEDGKMVLTAHFLSGRGYCCENSCRHCPYGFRSREEPRKVLRAARPVDNRSDASKRKES